MIVISGPSSVGKNTLLSALGGSNSVSFIVPSTSRPPRIEERSGTDYEFVDRSQFQSGIIDGLFFDWDYALNNYYGFRTNVLEGVGAIGITHALARMALRMRTRVPGTTLVFLHPTNESEHEARLRERFPDPYEREMRTRHWHEELAQESLFDYILPVTGGLEALSDPFRTIWQRLGVELPPERRSVP